MLGDPTEAPLGTLVIIANADASILGGTVGPEAVNGDGAVDNH